MYSHHVVIIGGGITGLTTALELLQRNYKVTVVAERYRNQENRITSQIAGALWEWPPAVCGRHTDPLSLERSKKWCMVGYEKFKKMAADPDLSAAAGVKMRLAKFFFVEPVFSSIEQVSLAVNRQLHLEADFSSDEQDE
jgi:D-amino-acid oxidase